MGNKKNYKIGLKLFSKNITNMHLVERLYADGRFDYLELMTLPDTYDETIKYWQKISLPYVVHVPHATYGFNLSDRKLRKSNKKIFNEARRFADKLMAEFIIVHPGITGEIEETIFQIQKLKETRLVVENMPLLCLRQTRCQGSSPEEIKQILQQTKIGFCFDIVHAVKAAYAHSHDYIAYLSEFLKHKPKIIHLCDCTIKGCFDEHLNFGKGELDLRRILQLSLKAVPRVYFTLEAPEKSYSKLTNFKKDSLLIANYLKG